MEGSRFDPLARESAPTPLKGRSKILRAAVRTWHKQRNKYFLKKKIALRQMKTSKAYKTHGIQKK